MAGVHNFVLKQGSTHIIELTWQDDKGVPVNLRYYKARMQVRENDVDGRVVVDLSTENNGIILEPSTGKIRITISAEESANVSTDRCVYDLELVNGNYVERILEGTIRVSRNVTR